jgi:uncharacterized glyoxalase superfamily protein PhnB
MDCMTRQDGAIGHTTVRIGDWNLMVSDVRGVVGGNTRLTQFIYENDTDATHKFAIFIL